MRVGIIGGGTIARLVLEHIGRGDLGEIDVAAIAGRSSASRGRTLAAEYGVTFVTALADRHAKDDVKLTVMRLDVVGPLDLRGGRYTLAAGEAEQG